MRSYNLTVSPELYRPDEVVANVTEINFGKYAGFNVAFDAHGTLYEWAWGEIPVEIREYICCYLDDGTIRKTAIASNLVNPFIARRLGMINPLLKAAEAINAAPFPLYGPELKPSPTGLARMTELLKWNPLYSIYIDDQLMGIRAAKDAGFGVTILVSQPIGREPFWITHKRRGPEAEIRAALGITPVD